MVSAVEANAESYFSGPEEVPKGAHLREVSRWSRWSGRLCCSARRSPTPPPIVPSNVDLCIVFVELLLLLLVVVMVVVVVTVVVAWFEACPFRGPGCCPTRLRSQGLCIPAQVVRPAHTS